METVGLREVRQHASELVRRAQSGERITVTVSGRPAAELGPVRARAWQTWEDVREVFSVAPDVTWSEDRDLINDEVRDPWE